ncbi:molybdopterin-guanine dinucleotide biosynthesis protein A [Agromyces hippuratus]|uniref:Molybdopterin-guanine dinucleotide biosynthesis protein A n=1 Tax=Agromyces hippuratus TaxID=286438 RepID=A0A852X2I0_9MICO|nr:NTP transferase domain-containing protein [Agromyces hippuratus]NYG20321.1 molybdopterin-guanine dinucleotide biosynthesis protein A [Agromyces hippuratus]
MTATAPAAASAIAAYDAIVLAGGRGSRLGGIDKTALTIDGTSLAARAVGAVSGARAVAYVSSAPAPRWVLAERRIRVAAEDPPWSGPVAAIAAGLEGLADRPQPFTVVLAGDLVGAAPAVQLLLARVARTVDGVVGVDPDGFSQPLLAVYRTTALRGAVAEVLAMPGASQVGGRGASMGAVLARLRLRGVALRGSWCADVDTPADAARHGIVLPIGEVRRVRVA